MIGTLSYGSYLDHLREECARVVVLAEQAPRALVATCPGWEVGDVVDHLAGVYQRMAANVSAGDASRRAEVADPAPVGVAGFEAAAAELARLLEAAGPDRPAWNWSGEDLVTGWVARRAALETAVHRADAALACGRQPAVDGELSVDGLDERLELFWSRPRRRAAAGGGEGGGGRVLLPGSLCIVATDADAAWLLEPAGERLTWQRRRGPADAVVAGPASSLFLWAWDRLPLAALELSGRADVAAALSGFGP